MSTQAFALLGSGEFDPWSAVVDEWLTTRGEAPSARVLVIPTACAAEGDEVFDMWASKGLGHYATLGIPAEVLPLKTREDAARPEFAAALEGAAVAYFSGGNPAYLARVLIDTPFWGALREAMTRGLAYAGCSAGVACLGTGRRTARAGASTSSCGSRASACSPAVPSARTGTRSTATFGAAGLHRRVRSQGNTLVAIDENTAMMGDGTHWQMAGVGSVHVLSHGGWTEHAPGSTFELPGRLGFARHGDEEDDPDAHLTHRGARARDHPAAVEGLPRRPRGAELHEPAGVPHRDDPVRAVHRRA